MKFKINNNFKNIDKKNSKLKHILLKIKAIEKLTTEIYHYSNDLKYFDFDYEND